jgi:hypothetical protein
VNAGSSCISNPLPHAHTENIYLLLLLLERIGFMFRLQLHSIPRNLQNRVVARKDVVVQDEVLMKHNKKEGCLAVGILFDCCVRLLMCSVGDLTIHLLMVHPSIAHPIASRQTCHHNITVGQ